MSQKSEIADGIVLLLEDLYYDNKITIAERDHWYWEFGFKCNLPDLLGNVGVRIRSIISPLPPAKGDAAMATKSIIIGKNKDKVIPDTYLEKVLAEVEGDYQALGIAYADKGLVTFARAQGDGIALDSVKEVMDNVKQQAVFIFMNSTTEIHEEDLQPYSLIEDENGKPILMAVLEGKFPNYEQGDNAHMPEHFVINDYLNEKLEKIYEEKNGDLPAIIKELDSPTFRKELRNLFVPRGAITMIGGDGTIVTFAKNDLAGSYPWGWTSNKLDYVESGAVSTKKVPLTLMDQLKSSAESKPAPKTDTKTDTKIPDGAGEERIQVPTGNRRTRKKWFSRNVAKFPSDWETVKDISATILLPGSPLRMSLKSFQQLTKEDVETAKAQAAERTDILLIPAGQRKVLLDKFVKTLNAKSDVLITKEKMDQMEEDYPTFSEQTEDYPLQLALHWPVDWFGALVKECPAGAIALLNEFRHELLKARPELLRDKVVDKERKAM